MSTASLPGAAFVRDAGLGSRLFARKSMPLFLQMESSECGLACLAMVAGHFGQGIRMEDLRAKFDVSVRGTSLADLATMADQIGLNARCVELTADELGQLRLPAVLHWEGNHWVVLKKISPKGLQLNDPAQGNAGSAGMKPKCGSAALLRTLYPVPCWSARRLSPSCSS